MGAARAADFDRDGLHNLREYRLRIRIRDEDEDEDDTLEEITLYA